MAEIMMPQTKCQLLCVIAVHFALPMPKHHFTFDICLVSSLEQRTSIDNRNRISSMQLCLFIPWCHCCAGGNSCIGFSGDDGVLRCTAGRPAAVRCCVVCSTGKLLT